MSPSAMSPRLAAVHLLVALWLIPNPLPSQVVPLGAPRLVPTGTAVPADGSVRAQLDPTGGFRLVWRGPDGLWTRTLDRRGRLPRPTPGAAVRLRFEGGSGTEATDRFSDLALSPGGDILLAAGDHVWRFGPDGLPGDAPALFDTVEPGPGEIPGRPPLNRASPALAALPDGGFAVAWSVGFEAPEAGVSFARLYYRRFAPDGTPREPPVELAEHEHFSAVDLAAGPDGSLQIVWAEATGDPASDVLAQAFVPTGSDSEPLPEDFGTSGAVEGDLRLVTSGEGRFLAGYTNFGGQVPDGLDGDCTGAFALGGAGLIQLTDDPSDCQFGVTVAGGGGSFLAAWDTGIDDPELRRNPFHGLRVRLLGADGTPSGDALWVRFRDQPLDDLAWNGTHGVLVGARGGALIVQTVASIPAGPCRPGPGHLCLDGPVPLDEPGAERFRADWVARRGPVAASDAILSEGRSRTWSRDSGAFWLFQPDNPELVVKVLDGSAVNGHAWVFAGALTGFEWWLTVTETGSRRQRTYRRPAGPPAAVADTLAFPASPSDPTVSGTRDAPALDPAPDAATPFVGAAPRCLDNAPLLELGGRFLATVEWTDPRTGGSGPGLAVVLEDGLGDGASPALPGASAAGAFWFFHPANLEVVLKLVDGTTVNGHHWLFVTFLSDLRVDLEVIDTFTGTVVPFHKEPFLLHGIESTEAFPEP